MGKQYWKLGIDQKNFEGMINYIIMEKSFWKTFSVICSFIFLTKIAYTQNQTRVIGNNTLVNWNFELPAFNTQRMLSKSYARNFTGWNCSGTCELVSIPYLCGVIDSRYCIMQSNNQAIDLQSPSGSYNLSQQINNSTMGIYQLCFLWLPPRINSLDNKSMAVLVNDRIITNITLNSTNHQVSYWNTFLQEIALVSGINVLKFVMKGPNDGFGILIDNIQLKPVIYLSYNNSSSANSTANSTNSTNSTTNSTSSTNSTTSSSNGSLINNESIYNNSVDQNATNTTSQQGISSQQSSAVPQMFLEFMLNNSAVSSMNSIPGSRILFSFLMNFYVNFDRLQFYYFHRQNFTQYAQIFLSSVHYFQEAKGSFTQITLRMICSQYNKQNVAQSYLEEKTADLQLKSRYRKEYIFQKGGKGDTFISSQLTFLYYQVPTIIIIHLLLWCLFRFIFNYRISRIFRKYCMLGTFFLSITEGNVEEFVFYFFTDVQKVFHSSFYHKVINTFSFIFGFLCCFFSFCTLIILYGLYKKLVKYLIEDYKATFESMLCITLQSGIFPFLSGLLHAYFYDSLLVLTLLLVLMQSIWIVVWYIFLRKNIFIYRRKAIINICNCLLRIYLAISLYLYEMYHFIIINQTHYYFIFIFLSLWILEILITFYIFMAEVLHFLRASCVKNKIRNVNSNRDIKSIKRKETQVKVMQFRIGARRELIKKGACESQMKHSKKINKFKIQYITR